MCIRVVGSRSTQHWSRPIWEYAYEPHSRDRPAFDSAAGYEQCVNCTPPSAAFAQGMEVGVAFTDDPRARSDCRSMHAQRKRCRADPCLGFVEAGTGGSVCETPVSSLSPWRTKGLSGAGRFVLPTALIFSASSNGCVCAKQRSPAMETSVSPTSIAPSAPNVQTNRELTATPEPSVEHTCHQRIQTALGRVAEPADLLGNSADRANLFMRIKGEPLIFARSPEYLPTKDVGILAYRRWLERTKHPLSVLGQLYSVMASRPDLLRETLLRDGYKYAHDESMAGALVATLRVELLFREPELWIQRGETLHVVRRTSSGYVYTSGELAGQPATLLLFDRIGYGPVPEPLHLDLRSLRYRLHFDRMTVDRVTADHVVTRLRYGTYEVATLLRRMGARLERECELVEPSQAEQLAFVRKERERSDRAVVSLQRAMAKQVTDGLPFDEPKRERGQEDGKLRPLWLWRTRAAL